MRNAHTRTSWMWWTHHHKCPSVVCGMRCAVRVHRFDPNALPCMYHSTGPIALSWACNPQRSARIRSVNFCQNCGNGRILLAKSDYRLALCTPTRQRTTIKSVDVGGWPSWIAQRIGKTIDSHRNAHKRVAGAAQRNRATQWWCRPIIPNFLAQLTGNFSLCVRVCVYLCAIAPTSHAANDDDYHRIASQWAVTGRSSSPRTRLLRSALFADVASAHTHDYRFLDTRTQHDGQSTSTRPERMWYESFVVSDAQYCRKNKRLHVVCVCVCLCATQVTTARKACAPNKQQNVHPFMRPMTSPWLAWPRVVSFSSLTSSSFWATRTRDFSKILLCCTRFGWTESNTCLCVKVGSWRKFTTRTTAVVLAYMIVTIVVRGQHHCTHVVCTSSLSPTSPRALHCPTMQFPTHTHTHISQELQQQLMFDTHYHNNTLCA